MHWEVPIVNKDGLIHLNQLLALNNYSGEKLLKLPINEKINSDSLIRQEYEAPRNEIDKKLVKMWLEILKLDKVGINDNFFSLGGHSLKAISLISKVHKEFNVEIPLVKIFETPTIKELSKFIVGAEENIYSFIEKAEEKEYYEASSAQKRMYLLQNF